MFITDKQRDQVIDVFYKEKGIKLDPTRITILSLTAGNSSTGLKWLDQDGKEHEALLSIRDVADLVKTNLTLSTKLLTWEAILEELYKATGVRVIDTDVDPASTDVTNLIFPPAPGVIGTVFLRMSPSSHFFKGEIAITLSSEDEPAQSPVSSTSKSHSTPFMLVGYTSALPEDTLRPANVDGSVRDIYSSLYNLVTTNVWTVEQIEKVAEDKIVLIGTFDIEYTDPNGNVAAVPNGTMILVDSTGRIISVDTTPRGVTKVHILWHPMFDKFVMSYNVAGNSTVFKLYDYDLNLAPATSTLPVGPMTSVTMDALGSIYVASGPSALAVLTSSVARIALQPTGFYVIDPVFTTVTLTDLVDPNETSVITSMVLLGDLLYARFSSVTSPSGNAFSPVVNGSNVRQPPIFDNNLAFGYTPVIPISVVDGSVDASLNLVDFDKAQSSIDSTIFKSATGVLIDPVTVPYRDIAVSDTDKITTISPIVGDDGRSKHQIFDLANLSNRSLPALESSEVPTMVLDRDDVDNYTAILAYDDVLVTAVAGYNIEEQMKVYVINHATSNATVLKLNDINPATEVTIHLLKEYPL